MTRILIAEDSPDQRHFLAESLIDEGYLVDTAATGEIASKKLENNYYDLAVLDVRMPRKNGLTVLKELRQRKPFMPVIMVSAFATIDDTKRFIANGASAALSKLVVVAIITNGQRGAARVLDRGAVGFEPRACTNVGTSWHRPGRRRRGRGGLPSHRSLPRLRHLRGSDLPPRALFDDARRPVAV